MAEEGACVVLLHGLARTENSMLVLQEALEAQGYAVIAPRYRSTSAEIDKLARQTLPG
ncbi:MAG TPA: acetyltransferase, partial [Roseovarius nubinhibens]|nr:acetyltransferase [Roseovarius nubinhibens]